MNVNVKIIGRHRLIACLGLFVAAILGGCRAPAPAADRVPLPTYAEAADKYNANIGAIDQVWSRAVATLQWRDERGRRRFEQGDDCFVVVVPPDRVALSIGKLGNAILWAGSDAQRYWLFDLQPPRTLYTGRHETVGLPCSEPLPAPIHPLDLVRLLGIIPLPVGTTDDPGSVERLGHQWLIEPPGGAMRLLVDPQTARPTRIDLLGPDGYSRVVANLSHYEPVQMFRVPTGGVPHMATRFEINIPGQEGAMSLRLAAPTDGRENDRIQPDLFDIDRLTRALRPEQTVILDRDCP